MKRAVFLVMMVVLLISLVAVGCAQSAPAPATSAPAASTSAAASQPAAAPAKPAEIVFASSGTGNEVYISHGTLAELMTRKYNIKTKVIPMDEKFARYSIMKSGEGQISSTGGTGLYCLEVGVLDMAVPDWGPQDFQMTYAMSNAFMPAVTQDAKDINKISDLKGKKVTFMSEQSTWLSPAAILAYGGLGIKDVVKVPVGGMGAQPASVLAGKADAVGFAASVLAPMENLASSPKGLKWLQLPHADKEAWKRVQTVAPMVFPTTTKEVVGSDGKTTFECVGWFQGQFAYSKASEDIAYWTTKTIYENLDELKKIASVWNAADNTDALDTTKYLYPYHAGSIKYFKEIGKWTSAHDVWQAKMIKQQTDLKAAWQKTLSDNTANKWTKEQLEQEWDARQKAITGFDTAWAR
jgi:TRAP transporter TAXI family solute receptor